MRTDTVKTFDGGLQIYRLAGLFRW